MWARETGRQTESDRKKHRKRWRGGGGGGGGGGAETASQPETHREEQRDRQSQAETDRDVNNLAIQFACKTDKITTIHKLRALGKSCGKLPSKTHKTLWIQNSISEAAFPVSIDQQCSKAWQT